MKVAMVNGKGGSGKTTVTILLAYALSEAGHSVGILDTDPQGTATRAASEAGGLELCRAGQEYIYVLVDTPPRLDTRSAIHESDIVLVVTGPSPADLFTTMDTIRVLKAEGAESKSRVLFNQVQPGTVLSRDLDERVGLAALKSRIQRRQAFQHVLLTGWKALPPEARDEVFKVALEVASIPHSHLAMVVR
jgi:chromosome partitioning protein